jgi:hypothetical protein
MKTFIRKDDDVLLFHGYITVCGGGESVQSEGAQTECSCCKGTQNIRLMHIN